MGRHQVRARKPSGRDYNRHRVHQIVYDYIDLSMKTSSYSDVADDGILRYI